MRNECLGVLVMCIALTMTNATDKSAIVCQYYKTLLSIQYGQRTVPKQVVIIIIIIIIINDTLYSAVCTSSISRALKPS